MPTVHAHAAGNKGYKTEIVPSPSSVMRPMIAQVCVGASSACMARIARGSAEISKPPDVIASSAEVGAFVQSVTLYVLEHRG